MMSVSLRGAAFNLALLNAELLGQRTLQTSGVETGKCSHLTGFQTAVEQCYQTGEVGWVEDDNHVLHVRAVLLDVLAQSFGNLAVALQQVLAGHTGLTWSTARRDNVLCILEGFSHIGRSNDVSLVETALSHLLGNTFYGIGSKGNVVKTNLTCQAHHQGRLHHV